MSSPDADVRQSGDLLALHDIVVMPTPDADSLRFEVFGLVADDEQNTFAVCYCESADEFLVTNERGIALADETLAQEILDDFFVLADEPTTHRAQR